MRDTFCSVLLEFIFEVFALTQEETNISVKAINEVGPSDASKWSNSVEIPIFIKEKPGTIRPVSYTAP